MTHRITKALLLGAALFASAGTAQASDTQSLLDSCITGESSNRAVMACTKLVRQTVDARVQGELIATRAAHRVAMGNHKAAARDFDHAAALTDDRAMASLSDGFAAIGTRDLATAQARFEDCGKRGDVAPMAAYGLGVTHDMAGRSAEARDSFQQALLLKPEWALAQERLRKLG